MRWKWKEIDEELRRKIAIPSISKKIGDLAWLQRVEKDDVIQDLRVYVWKRFERWPPPPSVGLAKALNVVINGFFVRGFYTSNRKKRMNSQKEVLFGDIFSSGEEVLDIEDWVTDFSSPEETVVENDFLDFLKRRLEEKEWQRVLNFLEGNYRALGFDKNCHSRLKEKLRELIEEYNN